MALRVTESIGAAWADRKTHDLDLDWANVFHTRDGRVGMLAWDGGHCVLMWSRDGTITWDQKITLEGTGLPMDCRVDEDGQIHALRWSGSALRYERLTGSGRVLYGSDVLADAVIAASVLPQKDGSLLVRAIIGKTTRMHRSWDGGLSWEREV